ncbi:MAG: TIGR01777 family oxidoreductase [Bacteroidota bacterium]
MRHIVIAGGSGFLGQSLASYFEKEGDKVTILSRKPHNGQTYWDGKQLGSWVETLEGADVLINLAGKSVDCRYGAKNRQYILNSRLESTTILQEAMESCSNPPEVWLNASSATIYIHAESQLMTEDTGVCGDDFSMSVCKKWEATFFSKELENVRKVALRTSIVLGNEGGAFPKMKWLTRLGFGGRQGNGQQLVSWLHIIDFCRAIAFVITNLQIEGVINVTAPNPVSNKVFMKYLQNTLKIPFGIFQPRIVLEVGAFLLGTETELLLKSRNVYPEKLHSNNFEFMYPTLPTAFAQLCL